MKNLAIICSKDPTNILLETVENLDKYYFDFDIAIIDADSAKTHTYNIIKEKFPRINIHFIKNKNYEFGAYKAGYELYPDYNTYMCLQDATVPLKRFSFEDMEEDDVYHLPHHSGLSDNDIHLTIGDLLRGTRYYKIFSHFLKEDIEISLDKFLRNFSLTTLNFFVIKNANLKELIETLPNLPKNKKGSCSNERILSICFFVNELRMVRLNWTPCIDISRENKSRRAPYAGGDIDDQEPVYFHKEYFDRE